MNKRYNCHLKKIIELSEGENFCLKCDGKGVVPKEGKIFGRKGIINLVCNKCLGDGKLDWVEKVVGKRRKYDLSNLSEDDHVQYFLSR